MSSFPRGRYWLHNHGDLHAQRCGSQNGQDRNKRGREKQPADGLCEWYVPMNYLSDLDAGAGLAADRAPMQPRSRPRSKRAAGHLTIIQDQSRRVGFSLPIHAALECRLQTLSRRSITPLQNPTKPALPGRRVPAVDPCFTGTSRRSLVMAA